MAWQERTYFVVAVLHLSLVLRGPMDIIQGSYTYIPLLYSFILLIDDCFSTKYLYFTNNKLNNDPTIIIEDTNFKISNCNNTNEALVYFFSRCMLSSQVLCYNEHYYKLERRVCENCLVVDINHELLKLIIVIGGGAVPFVANINIFHYFGVTDRIWTI